MVGFYNTMPQGEVLSIFIATIGILLLLFTGIGLQFIVLPPTIKISSLSRWYLSVSLALIAIPLGLFYCRQFLGFTINTATLLSLLGCFWMIIIGKQVIHTKISVDSYLKALQPVFQFVSMFTLAFVIPFFLFFSQSWTLPGGDSPFYLNESSSILRSGRQDMTNLYDRNIVLYLPVVFKLIADIPLEIGIRLMASFSITLTIILATIWVMRLTGHNWLGLVTLVVTGVNPGLYTLSLDLYAHALATWVLGLTAYVFWEGYTTKSKHNNWYLLGAFFWGCLFNIHGFVSFASLLVLTPAVILLTISHYRTYKPIPTFVTAVLALSIFLFSSQPLLFSGWRFFNKLIIKPLTNISAATQEAALNQTQILNRNTQELGLLSLPLHKQDFVEFQTVSQLLLAFVSIILTCVGYNHKRQDPLMFVVVIFMGYFLLTQQQIFGFNWTPSRFTMGITVPTVVLASLGLLQMYNRMNRRNSVLAKITVCVLTVLILGENISKVRPVWAGYKPSITQQRYNYFKNIVLDHNSLVFTLVNQLHWPGGLHPEINFFHIKQDLICNPKVLEQVTLTHPEDHNVKTAWAFSGYKTDTEALSLLQQVANGTQIYILVDDQHPCYFTNWEKIPGMTIISRDENVSLLMLQDS